MKKVLFFALMAAAVLGCKRSPDITAEPEPEPELTDAIMLSSGNPVALSRAPGDTTANQGPRLNEFVLEDQIGIYAVYTDRTLLLPSGTPKPDWADPGTAPARSGRYFDNKPAACKNFKAKDASTPLVRWASFLWGATGQGGVGIDQLYPKGEDSIFIYGYYPYHADSMVMDNTVGPRRQIRLDTLNPLKQADILWAVGQSKAATPAPYVKRKDPLAPLSFKHALAQLNFKVYKKGAGVKDCQFVGISFRCPVYGLMRITDGNMYITDSNAKDSVGTYKITGGQAVETVLTYDADVSKIDHLLATPYMVLPMSATQAQACKLDVSIYYGKKDADTDPTNVKTYPIILTNIKAFVQGSLNTLLLGVGDTEIDLLADIEPWDNTNGNDSELDIE